MTGAGVRAMVVWAPDWPVIAAEKAGLVPAGAAVAVMHANRVVACSAAARRAGVRRSMRKRDSQRLCPDLLLVEHDPNRDAIEFEPVVAAIEGIGAGVAVVRPGVCALAAKGPGRYFGGEEKAAELMVDAVAGECDVEVEVGIAEGVFAGLLAARAGRLVEPGGTAAFLAPVAVHALERPKLVDLLRRLGIHTLGAFAALPASDVLARFGLDAWIAHRLAAGQDDEPLYIRQPPPDLVVEHRFDDPIDRVDTGAFAARMLAEQLHERLAGYGLVATRLSIEATTADGQQLWRMWRHDGVLTAQAIADRTRWQLDGWITRRKLTSGITVLRLIPEGVLHQVGLQPGLWGEAGSERDQAHRAMHRVQGQLGPDSVLVAVDSGGRHPAERVTLVPFGDERAAALEPNAPWPGGLTGPLPSRFVVPAQAIQVLDAAGEMVTVTARLELSAVPAKVHLGSGRAQTVIEAHGPWPADERWWDHKTARRLVWVQLVLEDTRAVLAELSGGQWILAGWFD
ncbi:DNA polymerase Y family protein [Catelliglobosispora koreensis]|uniref:DNA polymerase Y family protein n=1 Tax=Catelliglobosispora koreensis TaxID=129052 RepID=UPI0003702AA5|nr:DNA polymerase Y family protein [Catelliglobosispora koreensis]